MEREPLDDKFMPGLADRFVAENPCPTSYRGARPKRTSTTIKTQFALAGEGKLDPIEDDGLSIQLKLDAIEAQAPKALLATPQRRCGSGSGSGLGVNEAPTTPHRGTPLGQGQRQGFKVMARAPHPKSHLYP